jgi:hypothetical protein
LAVPLLLRYPDRVEGNSMRPAHSFPANAVAGETRCCALVPGVKVRDVADACRSAALGFAWSAHHGWGRRGLARWLVGPYAQAAAPTRALRTSGTRPAVAGRTLDEDTVEELLARARMEVLTILRGLWSWSDDAAFLRARIDEGLIAGVIDESSGLGFAPVDRPGMRLVDRVRSLFVADYLTRPGDYAAFALCDDCDGATFDGGLYHVDCTRPRSRSRLRRRAPRELVLPADFAHPDLDDDEGPNAVSAG